MVLQQHTIEKLEELYILLDQLSEEYYTKSFSVLSDATIGQHFRHIIEFYIELEKGISKGVISYDERKRDMRLETELPYTKLEIKRIIDFVKNTTNDKAIKVKADYGEQTKNDLILESSLYRELAFTLEHTVHHMAIFKSALILENIKLSENFGIAASTKRYRNTCVQ